MKRFFYKIIGMAAAITMALSPATVYADQNPFGDNASQQVAPTEREQSNTEEKPQKRGTVYLTIGAAILFAAGYAVIKIQEKKKKEKE